MKLGDLVLIEWRDSFSDHDQSSVEAHPKDCRWISVGWLVRTTELFLTICTGVELTAVTKTKAVDNLLSIPWAQVVDQEVLL